MFGHNSEQEMHAGRPHGRPVTTQNIFLATMIDGTTSGGLSGHGGVPWAYSREILVKLAVEIVRTRPNIPGLKS